MPKRVETNIPPVSPMVLELARDIADDPKSTKKEKYLALGLLETAAVLNKLLLMLEYGMVSISDDPPDSSKQFSRRTS